MVPVHKVFKKWHFVCVCAGNCSRFKLFVSIKKTLNENINCEHGTKKTGTKLLNT